MLNKYFNFKRKLLQVLKYIILKCNNKIIIGKNVKIDFNSKLIVQGQIYLGNNISLRSFKRGYHAGMPFSTTILVDNKDAKVRIGDNTRINGAYIHSQKSITIGKNCVIASGVQIIDTNGHEVFSIDRTIGRDIPKEIIIGENVWIGINAIILKGTVIGNNCVIGANTVIKGQYFENSIITTANNYVKKVNFEK